VYTVEDRITKVNSLDIPQRREVVGRGADDNNIVIIIIRRLVLANNVPIYLYMRLLRYNAG